MSCVTCNEELALQKKKISLTQREVWTLLSTPGKWSQGPWDVWPNGSVFAGLGAMTFTDYPCDLWWDIWATPY